MAARRRGSIVVPGVKKSAQHPQVDRVPIHPVLLPFRSFQIHGDVAETGVGQQESERLDAQFAATDVLVTVDPAALRAAAVIEVKCPDAAEPHQPVERGHRGLILVRRPQGVARREDVAGVETDAQAIGLLHAVDDLGKLLESPAERGPLAGGSLQQASGPKAARLGMNLVERPNDALQAACLAAGRVSARMSHDVRDAQHFRPAEFLDKRGDRLPPQPAIGTGQVNQIRIVGDRVAEAQVVQGRTEPPGFVGRNGIRE